MFTPDSDVIEYSATWRVSNKSHPNILYKPPKPSAARENVWQIRVRHCMQSQS